MINIDPPLITNISKKYLGARKKPWDKKTFTSIQPNKIHINLQLSHLKNWILNIQARQSNHT
jgi:hypothetical protein